MRLSAFELVRQITKGYINIIHMQWRQSLKKKLCAAKAVIYYQEGTGMLPRKKRKMGQFFFIIIKCLGKNNLKISMFIGATTQQNSIPP